MGALDFAELEQLREIVKDQREEIEELRLTCRNLVAGDDRCAVRASKLYAENERLKKQSNWIAEELKGRRKSMEVLRKVFKCGANRDGECNSENCPQKIEYLTGCPLYDWDEDEEGISILRPIPPTEKE